jgi:hypothetical protein
MDGFFGSVRILQIGDFLALDNILNTDPPIISNSTQTSLPCFFEPTRTDLYDDLGMSVRVGVRMHVD